MSGGKGTQQTGSATKSETNPLAPYVKGAADYLTPYAQDPNRPYTAPPNPLQTSGYYDVANTGANLGGWPMAKQYDAYGNLITGGGTSPAYGGYAQMAAGGSGPQQTSDRVVNNAVNAAYGYANPITGYADQAVASGNQYGSAIANLAGQAGANNNLGLTQLGQTAQGDYLNSNPYLAKVIQNTLDPITRNFQTSVMPSIDAAAARSGRGGSGALLGTGGLYGNAETVLGNQLGQTTAQLNFQNYDAERARQVQAAQQYGSLFNQGTQIGGQLYGTAGDQVRQALGLGIQGQQAAGNLVNQGQQLALNAADLTQRGQTAGLQGLTTGFNTGLTTQEAALRDYNNFAAGQMIPAQADIQAGTGLRDLDTSQLREPYDRVGAYLKAISGGGTTGGSSSTQPIFGNPLTSTISGLGGALGLGKELGLGSGLNSLFGGSGAAGLGGTFGGGGEIGAGFGSIGEALAAGLPEAGFGLSEALPLAATAGVTIVCTELVRQGRMPNTWRLAGMRQFMRYPAIARRGYWVWATPVVAHLRKRPDSRFSKAIERTFNWRAEDLAARNGVKGARRLIRGRLVTAAMVIPCLACGLMTTRDYFPGGKDAPA